MDDLDLFDPAYYKLTTDSTTTFETRPYQEDAIEALLESLRDGHHPVCNLPTGAGKGYIIARMAQALPGRILVATHRRELLSQNEGDLLALGATDTGIYSAGLKRREHDARVVFGGIQSVYRRIDKLQETDKFDYIIIDECHLVTPPGIKSMYSRVLWDCQKAQRIGLSATPYRLQDGPVYGDPNTHWFDHLAVDIGIQELTDQGYLSPLRSYLTASNIDTSKIHKRAGEFVTKELSEAARDVDRLNLAIDELCELAEHRQSWLVFGIDIAHTEAIHKKLIERGITSEMVVGNTPDRDAIFDSFKAQEFRALVGCEVFTTGFNARAVDCVAVLRPTESKGLFVQMAGRGTRLSPETGKQDCLLLDLGGNLERHAPLDGMPTIRKSRRKQEHDDAEAKAQEIALEKERQERERKHATRASNIDPLTGKPLGSEWLTCRYVKYELRRAKNRSADNIVVTYDCLDNIGLSRRVMIWLCLEYPKQGIAYQAAKKWFHRRYMPVPESAQWMMDYINGGDMFLFTNNEEWIRTKPKRICVEKDDNGYDRVIDEEF